MATPTPEPPAERQGNGTTAQGASPSRATAEAPTPRSASAPPSIPDHEVLRRIGRGAYGAVWLARNVMGTYRAVKIIDRGDFSRDRPFTREYEGLLKFEPVSRSHPNLMQILHVGRRGEYFYYVTELADDARGQRAEDGGRRTAGLSAALGGTSAVAAHEEPLAPALSPSDGERVAKPGEGNRPNFTAPAPLRGDEAASYVPRTLREDLERRGRLPVRECVSLATALAAALKHLHDHGLVHRDVKPSNVIFVHGVPKLADIGLVATAGDSGSIVGTEGYLPPEGPGSPPADLYALGKLLYEACTGLNRADYPRLPPNLSELPDAADLLEFNEILLRACAKDTSRRYHRADDLLADLALLERGASVKRLRRLERHHALLRRVGVAVLAIGLLVSAAWWQSWRAGRIAQRHLARLHLSEGTQRMVGGDYTDALPWLVGALELDAGDPVREAAHRVCIASVLARCPLPVGHFSVPESRALAADLNADGTVLATAHEDGQVRLWDTRSGQRIRDREFRHDFPVTLCQFVPPGDRLLTITLGQKARLWNLTNQEDAPLVFDQMVGAMSDGYMLGLMDDISATAIEAYLSKGRHRWVQTNLFTGPLENVTLGLRLVGHGDTLAVHYTVRRGPPDGGIVCAGEFFDSPKPDPFARGRDDPPGPIWGRHFLGLEHGSTGDRPGDAGQVVWDNVKVRRYPPDQPPASTPWRVLDDFSAGVSSNWFVITPPGSNSTCQGISGQMRLLWADLPRERIAGPGVFWIDLIEVSPGHTLEVEVDLVSASAPHRMVALAIFRPRLPALIARSQPFIRHGRWMVSTWWDKSVRFRDLATVRSGIAQDPVRTPPLDLRFGNTDFDHDVSPHGKYYARVERGDRDSMYRKRASVWDLGTRRDVTSPHWARKNASGTRFSPDGRFLALTHADGIDLIRTPEWESAQSLATGVSYAMPRFSSRETRLAAVRNGDEVVVWDLGDTGEPPVSFMHHFEVKRIAFSPDGCFLVTSSADGLLWVWDAIRQEQLGPPLPGHEAQFSPDGTRLLVVGAEGGVWLWDLSRVIDDSLAVPPLRAEQKSAVSADGAMTATIVGQRIEIDTATGPHSVAPPAQAPLRRVAFSPDNRHLIAEDVNLYAWVWDTRTWTLTGPPRRVRYDATLTHHCVPNLSTEGRDWQTLSGVAALLGGQRPDGEGGMVPVDETEKSRLLSAVKRAFPAEFGTDEQHHARWHGHQAAAAEHAMDWDAAVFHWQFVLDSTSEGPVSDSPNPNHQSETSDLPFPISDLPSPISHLRSPISPALRLAYARQAAEAVRQAIVAGKSRWSAKLPRQPWATAEMLDLGGYYTSPLGERLGTSQLGVRFRELPRGVHVLGGTAFDVRGFLELDQTNPVTIPVGRACQRLHFLHATRGKAFQSHRVPAARYQVTYASGAQVSVDLQDPEDVPSYRADTFWAVSELAWPGMSPELDCALVWAGYAPGRGPHREPM
ncbi:MAG TPA: protein kinase, partial [Verrucomicrobiota bacterium]|nr:protein kinase [Verrucomicrobiota bacterium]